LHWHRWCIDDENEDSHMIYDMANKDHATVVNTDGADDDLDVHHNDVDDDDYNEQTNNDEYPVLDAAIAKLWHHQISMG